MLCISFTRNQLWAAAQSTDRLEPLNLQGKPCLTLSSASLPAAFETRLATVLHAYRQKAQALGLATEGALPVALAMPGDLEAKEQQAIEALWTDEQEGFSPQLLHVDKLANSFLFGLPNWKKLMDRDCLVLDATGDYLQICHRKKQADFPGEAQLKIKGAAAWENLERLEIKAMKALGAKPGRARILEALTQDLTKVGLQLDEETREQLSQQLVGKAGGVYTISRQQENASLEAEVKLDAARYYELLAGEHEQLEAELSGERLDKEGIGRVVLLGSSYLDSEVIKHYLHGTLGLNGMVLDPVGKAEIEEMLTVLKGVAFQAGERLRATRLQQEEQARRRREEEKRKQIESELQARQSRESLLKEIAESCTDPAKRSEYEATFVPRGEAMGIPDVVIKWNISELLDRILLQQQQQAIEQGDLSVEEPPVAKKPAPTPAKAEPKPEPKAEANGSPQSQDTPKPAEPAPKAEGKKKPELKQPTPPPAKKPEPVAEKAPANGTAKQPAVAEKVALQPGAIHSLNDLFVIRGTLPDEEFATKHAMLYSDKGEKTVRLLLREELADAKKVARFHKLYEKELKYFQELSEMQEAEEGIYFYREFIERTTLKEHVKRMGLTTKLRLEDLSSQELKFILQVFKEVQDLPVSHANLNEETILVLARRKWNLQKNVDIRIVGFTSEDASEEEMAEAVHAMFARLLGDKFYKEFRSKFSL